MFEEIIKAFKWFIHKICACFAHCGMKSSCVDRCSCFCDNVDVKVEVPKIAD